MKPTILGNDVSIHVRLEITVLRDINHLKRGKQLKYICHTQEFLAACLSRYSNVKNYYIYSRNVRPIGFVGEFRLPSEKNEFGVGETYVQNSKF